MSSPTNLAIEVRALVKRFGPRAAVDGLSFEVARGEIVGLLGPNGAGKTTTVNVLATLLAPDGGVVRVDGFDVTVDAHAVRSAIALTGQFAAVDDQLSAVENLVLFARLRGLSRTEAVRRAGELLDRFGLGEQADAKVRTYSGGMRRRLDLAASLVVEPRILFLDEPTTGLDPRSRAELWGVVRDLRQRGITIVLTTQYLEEADLLADRIVVIDQGRVIAQGSAAELKRSVGDASCVVSLVDAAQLEAAVAALGALGVVHRDADQSQLRLPATSGMETLRAALELLAGHGIEVHEAAIRRPSLDEVFLALTAAGR